MDLELSRKTHRKGKATDGSWDIALGGRAVCGGGLDNENRRFSGHAPDGVRERLIAAGVEIRWRLGPSGPSAWN